MGAGRARIPYEIGDAGKLRRSLNRADAPIALSMSTDIPLRPGAVFRPDSKVIEIAGRRFDRVRLLGTVLGTTVDDTPVPVRVLGAVRPVSADQIARRERLPAMAIVPVETHYLKADREILFSLFPLAFAVQSNGGLHPERTLVLPMHGSVDVDENGRMNGGGCPILPAIGTDEFGSVCRRLRWRRSRNGQPVPAESDRTH